MLQILKAYAAEGREARLVDFDDHLDDIKRRAWRSLLQIPPLRCIYACTPVWGACC